VCINESAPCACEVLATEPEGLSPSALAVLLRGAGRVSARSDALRARVIAEAERTHAAEKEGFRSTAEWLAALSGEPVPVARSQVAVAEALERMPETKAAFAAGDLPESRVRALAQAQALAPAQFAEQEAALLAQVAVAPSQQIPKVLAAWKRQADPEAAECEAERLHQRRVLHLSADWSGMLHLSGDLDPEGGLLVLDAVRSLSEPAALDPGDTRTPAQCRADALVEICRRYLESGNGSRRPPRVLITIPWDTLQICRGVIDSEAGPLPAGSARRLACDATVSRVVLDPESVPVEMGRATRIIPAALKKALELRDQHCTHPGCGVPARWCDAHHIVHWVDGGSTDLSNLRLLCRTHHRDAHQHRAVPRRE
jgi:hypothetical protein